MKRPSHCQICFSAKIMTLNDFIYCENCEIYYQVVKDRQKIASLPLINLDKDEFILCASCNHRMMSNIDDVISCRTHYEFFHSFPICTICRNKNSKFISKLFHNNFLNYKREGKVYSGKVLFLYFILVVMYIFFSLPFFYSMFVYNSKQLIDSIITSEYFRKYIKNICYKILNYGLFNNDFFLFSYIKNILLFVKSKSTLRNFVYFYTVCLKLRLYHFLHIDSFYIIIPFSLNILYIDFIFFIYKFYYYYSTVGAWYEIPYKRLLKNTDLHKFVNKMKLSHEKSMSQDFCESNNYHSSRNY